MALLLLSFVAPACAVDVYNAATRQLTIPSVQIGSSTYYNMVITVGRIVSGPSGTAPNGTEDIYDPGNNQLAVQAVTVGTSTYYNAVVTVAGLVSIGSVAGADTYDGSQLTVSQVQAGGTVYGNVAVSETIGDVVRVAGGMPTAVPDTYSAITNQLSIPAVQVGSRVYTNVVVTAGKLLSVGGIAFRNQESVVHGFLGYPKDGNQPQGNVIQGSDGNFYGTTFSGGATDGGAVIKVTPAGVETVLYSFQGYLGDALAPTAALIEGSDGNFYGTTPFGGTFDTGTVFKITPAGVETVLHSFGGPTADGSGPNGPLIQGSDGNFYGVTEAGGTSLFGTVYKITPTGVETVLYSFQGGTVDGNQPYGALTLGTDGNFYGTTNLGGASNTGTVFKITPAGAETLLYSFKVGGADGNSPNGSLIQGSDGSFYGTTYLGGTYGTATTGGTVFKITPAGVETVLYSFGSGGVADGSAPYGGLIKGSDGNFYGTTALGGTYGTATTGGTVFKVTPAGVETVLHSFQGGTTDGSNPESALILGSDGNLYSTTVTGGTHSDGTVFKITPAGVESLLYSFGGGIVDGSFPVAPVIQGTDGNFYAVTATGGSYDVGTVVSITPGGLEAMLYSFQGGTADGSAPQGALIQGSDGDFYSTTGGGGAYSQGTVVKITSTGVETVLYSFGTTAADGSFPNGAMIQGRDGNFYGTTNFGGAYSNGTVFRITPGGNETVLHSFAGGTADGSHPAAALIEGSDGNFYGTTQIGGTGNSGTVFRITPAGDEAVMYSFQPSTIGTGDGDQPHGALVQGSDGNFYGMTYNGGTVGYGTVFKVTPAGVETVQWSFGSTAADGAYPSGALIQGRDGNFYGTTGSGGNTTSGTVFKITPTGVETVIYSFGNGNTDGVAPYNALLQGRDGSFYGTTGLGGITGGGTFFKLTNVMPAP